MAEESDEALEISNNEESGTDRDDTNKAGSINFSHYNLVLPLSFPCWIA